MWALLSVAHATEPAVGEDTVVAVRAQVGFPASVGLRFTPFGSGRVRVGGEAFAGSLVLFTGLYGVGPRLVWTAAQDAKRKNAFVLSPGLDVGLIPADASPSGWFSGPSDDSTVVGANAEIGWTHQFRPHLGFDLGLRLGAWYGLDGPYGREVLPEVAIVTGLRL
jgi:hypothetical protein